VWRYTRHPNYFGDAVQWWAYFLVAASTGAWWTVFSPLVMTYLLVNVSGVPLLEKSLLENRPGYREYVQKTPAFFPWFPRAR
jgi:steroid 5-alpha reductase family enzyme